MKVMDFFNNSDFVNRFKNWTTTRYIDSNSQKKLYPLLINEELSEYVSGIINNNEHEIIDALADMVVVTYNTINGNDIEHILSLHKERLSSLPLENLSFTEFNEDKIAYFYKYIFNVMKDLYNDKDIFYDSVFSLIQLCFIAMTKYGYDPFKVMDECLKEIEDRTQDLEQKAKWDTIVAEGKIPNEKWKKDQRPEIQKQWYKANYMNCKVG